MYFIVSSPLLVVLALPFNHSTDETRQIDNRIRFFSCIATARPTSEDLRDRRREVCRRPRSQFSRFRDELSGNLAGRGRTLTMSFALRGLCSLRALRSLANFAPVYLCLPTSDSFGAKLAKDRRA